jgi:hypothetical protein
MLDAEVQRLRRNDVLRAHLDDVLEAIAEVLTELLERSRIPHQAVERARTALSAIAAEAVPLTDDATPGTNVDAWPTLQ